MDVVYIAGTERCQISVEEPAALIVALYLREVAGLRPRLEHDIPPLDPPITTWPSWAQRPTSWTPPRGVRTTLVDPVQASTQWSRWWNHLLTAEPSASEAFHPPGFRELRSVPAMQLLMQRHYEEAAHWVEAVSSDPRVKREQATPRPGLTALINDLESDRARIPLPFRLRLTIIPVQIKRAWPLAPEHILISRRLVADTDNVLDWLRPRILALAHGTSLVRPSR